MIGIGNMTYECWPWYWILFWDCKYNWVSRAGIVEFTPLPPIDTSTEWTKWKEPPHHLQSATSTSLRQYLTPKMGLLLYHYKEWVSNWIFSFKYLWLIGIIFTNTCKYISLAYHVAAWLDIKLISQQPGKEFWIYLIFNLSCIRNNGWRL